jgi:hypothetical protein
VAQLITREELALVVDEDISVEKFDALYRLGRRVLATGYVGDPEEATGHTADVIAGVLTGVMVRILSNPKGARQLSATGAAVTFGGSDVEISSIFTLTPYERANLAEVSPITATRSGAFTIYPGRVG